MKFFFIFSLIFTVSLPTFSKKWTATIAKELDQSENWIELIKELKTLHLNYGAEVGAERLLQYFPDIKSKEFAYATIIELIDSGYPYNLRPAFMVGDLELSGKENFAQSYNLYKASLDSDKSMSKWANNYFERIDKENFPKFLFYKALKEFNNKKLDESLVHLNEALARLKEANHLSLSKKVARTMARIYYEQLKYAESLDIYQNYLLKMNPVENGDRLEQAWNLYRLGKLEESLGALYNLELSENTTNQNSIVYLEKYIIRALIYREKCARPYTTRLAKSFEKDFGSTIEKIKMGESLKALPGLRRLVDASSDYRRYVSTISELQVEGQRIKELPEKYRRLAKFLYETEIRSLQKLRNATEDLALSGAARKLVIMGESLKFLEFDIVREQFNPDKVFAPPPPPKTLVENLADNKFQLHWLQWGDFWRDERMDYRGVLKNWCQ